MCSYICLPLSAFCGLIQNRIEWLKTQIKLKLNLYTRLGFDFLTVGSTMLRHCLKYTHDKYNADTCIFSGALGLP